MPEETLRSTLRVTFSWERDNFAYTALVAGCCLLAAGLRLYKLSDANPWWDEGFTYWLASQDLPGMLLRTAGDTHPPLSYFLYQVWMPLAGRSIFALRFQAALFGILAVPVCAAAARRLGGPRAGLLAALLLAIAPFHVWWSQQVRMYALVALLATLSTYLVLRSLGVGSRESGVGQRWRRASLGALFLTNLAGLYTLYFFAVLVLLEGLLVAWCWLRVRQRPLLATVYSLLAAPLPLIPWLLYFRQHAIRFPESAATPLTWLEFAQASWGELALGIDTGVQGYGSLLVALALVAIALLIVLLVNPLPGGKGMRVTAVWLGLVVVGLPLAAYGITLQRGLFFSPAYQTRYDLPALPALVVLVAWGISRLPRRAGLLPLALFAGAAVWSLPRLYDARHRTDDFQSLARFVEAYEQPGDAIVMDPDWNFHLFLLDYHGALPLEAIPLNQPVDAGYAAELFTRWTAQHRALWLLQEAGGHDASAQHPVRDWLQAHLESSLQLTLGDRLLILYEPAGASPRALNPAFEPQFKLQGAPGLSGFDRPLDSVRPGDVLHVTVYEANPHPRNLAEKPCHSRASSEESPSANVQEMLRSTLSMTPKGVSGCASSPLPEGEGITFAGQRINGRLLPGAADFSIPIGPAAAPGRQPLTLQLESGQRVELGSVNVELRPAPAAADMPPLQRPVGQTFGAQALLTSYALQPEPPRPGQDLTVDLQWRALQPFNRNYTVFVHVLDGANRVVAQRDSQPGGGQLPTVGWQPGQTYNDRYVLPLPAGLPPGRYQLEVGMYLQSTGERLRLADEQDRVLLPSVNIS